MPFRVENITLVPLINASTVPIAMMINAKMSMIETIGSVSWINRSLTSASYPSLPSRTIQRKPRCEIEVSTGCDMRAAGL